MLKKGTKEGSSNDSNKNINIDLQLNLLNTWTKFNVADYYQNIFLVHLDELTPAQAEELIKKQISLTLQKKSPFFQLEKLQKQRDLIIQKLRASVQEAEQKENQDKLNQVCQDIKELRQINLILAEHILKMYQIYHCDHIESTDKQMQYYDSMLSELDQENQFIKNSILNKHLKFDQGYDPFLMNQYERIHRNRNESINPAIKELFNLNISYAYRLLKTKNMILQLRSMVNRFDSEKMSEVAFTERIKQNQSNLSRRKYLSKDDPSRAIIDDEKAKIQAKPAPPIKIQPIHIYPSTYAKSRTTIYRDKQKESRPETSSITEVNSKLRLKFAKIPTDPPSSLQYSYINIKPENDRSTKFNEIQPNKSFDLNRKIRPMQKSFYDQRKRSIPLMNHSGQRQVVKPYRYKASVGQIYNRSIKLTPLRRRKQDNYRPEVNQSQENVQRRRLVSKQFNQEELPQRQPDRERESQKQKDRQRNREKQRQRQKQVEKQKVKTIRKQEETQPIQYVTPIQKQVKNYNPIKKQQYQTYEAQQPIKKSKYDFVPQKLSLPKLKNSSKQKTQSQEDENGLVYEDPISKYNLQRKKNLQKKANTEQQPLQKNPVKKSSTKQNEKVDQECQTIQMRKPPPPKEEPPKKVEPKKQQKAPEPQQQQDDEQSEQEEPPKPQKKTNTKQALNPDSDQTLQDQDIVDQRTKKQTTKPPIRTLNKEEKPTATQPTKTNTTTDRQTTKNVQNTGKKEIRMKVGKATVQEVIELLKNSKIKSEYLNSFDIQKTIAWIKVNQTYLTEFTVNDKTAIIALCSPIPNIGTALRFWASANDEIDFNASSNLFKKYLDFIQKLTTAQKVMFSGKALKELQPGQFVMKKQNFYQRARKTPAKQSNREFQPFVYIECSNLKFANKSKGKILYSQQIQEFTKENSFATSFIAQANNNSVPAPIKPLIKFNSKLQNFKQVNQILTKQQFDNYEAAQIQASNIDLMRFYLNSPLKSTFIAQDNCFKFSGTVIHQKDKEFVVGVGLAKNNGNIYFAKNLTFPKMLELVKKPSQTKSSFTVLMFNKKLYGKMPQVQGGCYGNWQVNLTWQDEMQGRIRHNMKQNIAFGPQNFKVLVEFQKVVVLGFEVNKQDLI